MSYSWWRLAFIFLPAAVRGDIGSLGLYVPVSVPRRPSKLEMTPDAPHSAVHFRLLRA
jgi:hypothetical protein